MMPKCKPPFKYKVGARVRVKTGIKLTDIEDSGNYTDEELFYLKQAIRFPATISCVKKCVCNFPYQLQFEVPTQPAQILFGEDELERIEIKVDDDGNLVT